MKIRLQLLLLLLLFAATGNAQKSNVESALIIEPSYKKMMYDFKVNFYTVCDSAEAYFKNRDKGKGSGYSPFLRWKYLNESRYYPSGDRMVDHYMPFKEYERIERESAANGNRLFATGGWHSLGPDTIGKITGHYAAGLGRVEYVEVNRNNPQQIYMASRSGGLWRTNNEGVTWSHNTDFLPASGVNTIAASPTNFDSVLINVQSGELKISFGIYRSVNGGQTFTPTNFMPATVGFGGLGSNFKIYIIKYHPRIPNMVLVGTSQGLYRSMDNLQTWTRQIVGGDVYDIAFHPTNNNIIYIYDGFFTANKNKILKSTDLGVTYTGLPDLTGNANSKIKIALSPTCTDCIFASSSNGIWKSTNGGTSFITTVTPAPVGISIYSALPNDLDTSKYVAGYVDLSRSTNGGASFTKCTAWSLGDAMNGTGTNQENYNNSPRYVHADNNYMTCVNGVFYSCTDGVLNKSSDNGVTWQKLSLTTGTRENYCVATSQSNHYFSVCGSQDNGTSAVTENGWMEVYGADGMEAVIVPLNPDYFISSTQNGGRQRSLTGGLTISGVGISGSTASWVAPMFRDPNDHFTVYSFGTSVYKTTTLGNTWTTLGSPSTFAGSTISVAAIAENNSSLIAISNSDKIELSTNGGVSFVTIKNNLPTRSISDIAFDPKNDSTIIVTYNDYQNTGQKIYISKNRGATWTNITYNLGNMPIHTVVIDHSNNSNIYLGAEVGVYTKTMSATTWSLYNSNLPNVTVRDLEINNGSNTLKAATWGRGLWEYSLINRNNHPAIIKTSISSPLTFFSPAVNTDQFVTSEISYSNTLTSVFVKWSLNNLDFNNTIIMNSIGNNKWKTVSALNIDSVGAKVFFKVYAVGSSGDTTETYKFMYSLKPNEYCNASGESINGNLYINNFSCASVSNNGTGNTASTFYPNKIISLNRNSTYNISASFNTGWSSNDLVAWIDYNKDSYFDQSEIIVFDSNTGSDAAGSFTVPDDALEDTVIMRVRLGYWGGFDDPCGTTLGEVEDYPVIINPAFPPGRKVLFIGVDGCRWDALQASNTPAIDSLLTHAIYSGNGLTEYKTWSGTGWSNMLTGAWHTKHGVFDNTFTGANFTTYPDFISRAENFNSALHTVSVVHWSPINSTIIQSIDNEITVTTDSAVKNSAVNVLATDNPDILFVAFDDVDHAGHTVGFSPTITAYRQAIETTDAYIAQVLTALYNRPNYANEDWLIVLTTDHGGIPSGHGGGTLEERTIFNIYSNKNFPPQNLSRIKVSNSSVFTEAKFNAGSYAKPINQTPFSFGTTQDFTVELWVKATTFVNDPSLISNKNWNGGLNKGFVISAQAGQYWKVNVGDGTKRIDIQGGFLNANKWHHLAVSFKRNGLITAYEDGVVVGFENMQIIGDINSGLPLVINQDGTTTYSQNFNGSYKDVRVWNTVIPQNTLVQWASVPVTSSHPNYANLLGNWKCEDGGGSILDDASINNNNCTITGTVNWITNQTDSLIVYDYSNTPCQPDNATTALGWLCIPVQSSWNLDGKSWVNSCELISNAGDPVSFQVFLEGLYIGNDSLRAVIDPTNMAMVSDTITLELHQSTAPYAILYSTSSVIDVAGKGTFVFPNDVYGNSYYLVFRHRNSIETWSKNPVTLNSSMFDLTH